jgi:hypothetical protein
MKKALFSVICLLPIYLLAQQLYLPLNQSYQYLDRYLYSSDNKFHTSVKPYIQWQTNKIVDTDSLYKIESKNKILGHILNKNIINYKKDDFSFIADPLFNFEFGKNDDTSKLSTINTRGVRVEGNIKNNFSFATSFYENQAFFLDHRKDRIMQLRRSVIPGQGLAKSFKEYGYDYAYAEGYISYTTNNNYFNVQFGHGKNFIGDGYRSLLLSDNSFNYPFLKITTDIWNIKYVNMWAQFQDVSERPLFDIGFQKKWGVFHYLDWQATKWLSIGLFESVIWQNQDSTGYRGFDWNYANPVIFYRPVEFSVGSPDNVLMGMTGKITINKNLILYGQMLIDEFKIDSIRSRTGWWGNKYALQGGIKVYDIFKIPKLDIQAEANYVRPYTYSHRSNRQNYGHFNQSLAHPLGSNFQELVCFLRYNYKRVFFEGRFSYAMHGQDTAGLNYGNDVFRPYNDYVSVSGNYIGQALQNYLTYTDLSISYLINYKNNMNVALGINNRRQENKYETINRQMIYFAFRTSLQNFYYDF